MIRTKLALWIIVTVMLLGVVEGFTKGELARSAIIYYLPDINVTTDNSTYKHIGQNVTNRNLPQYITTAKKLGSASAHFTNDGLQFQNSSVLYTMINQTIALWTNITTIAQTEEYILARKDSGSGGLAGEIEFKYSSTGPNLRCAIYSSDNSGISTSAPIGTDNHTGNSDWELIGCVINVTAPNICVQIILNTTVISETCAAKTFAVPITNTTIGAPIQGTSNKELTNVGIDSLIYSNLSWSTDDFNLYWNNGEGIELLDVTSVNFIFFDEETEQIIDDREVIVSAVAEGISAENHSTQNGTISFDLTRGIEYRITSSATDYNQRNYFFIPDNEFFDSLDLYLLNSSSSTDIIYTVQDNSGTKLENATIMLKKFFVTKDAYVTVAMARTNEEGKTLIDVDFNDAFYETLTTFRSFSLRTIGSKIISTTITLTMDLVTDPFTSFDVITRMTTSLTFNNNTETFSYVFTDTTGVSRRGLLEVHRISASENTLVCSNTATSASATLLCQVNTTNISGTYAAKGYIQLGSTKMNVLTDILNIITGLTKQLREKWGNQGIFFTILVSGAMAGLGAVISPAVAIIMFLAGLAVTSFFGMSFITMTFLGTFIIIGIVIIWKTKQ